MNIKKISFVIFGVSALLFLITFFLLLNPPNLHTEVYYSSVNVTDSIGFDLNSTALIFGNVFPGGALNRNLIFTNQFDFPIVLKIEANGTIKPLLIFDKTIRVGGGETKKIPFEVHIPKDYNQGIYDGYVKVDLFYAW